MLDFSEAFIEQITATAQKRVSVVSGQLCVMRSRINSLRPSDAYMRQ